MKTVTTMAVVFALLISLTACDNNPCNKYSNSHQKDYCNNKNASKEVISYLDNGATPSGEHDNGIFKGLTLKKAISTVNDIRKAVL